MRHLPSTDDREAHGSRSAIVRACAAIADATAFNLAIFAVILANALVLGLETYEGVKREAGGLLDVLDAVFLGVFVVELGIRFAAVGARPGRFFRSGWNVFDFVVVVAAFLPGLRENATLLRLARLARIVRVVRLLPDLRVLVSAVVRSVPGVLSLAVMTLLLIYLYGMVGWVILGEELPERYGNAGEAMLTMFVLLSLENLPTYIEEGRRVSDWTIVFFVSYVLVASFLVFNFFIGVIVNSMEQARAIEAEREAAERAEQGVPEPEPEPSVALRLEELRGAIDRLERELADGAGARPAPPTRSA
jgi:voltage-gated sodium channel